MTGVTPLLVFRTAQSAIDSLADMRGSAGGAAAPAYLVIEIRRARFATASASRMICHDRNWRNGLSRDSSSATGFSGLGFHTRDMRSRRAKRRMRAPVGSSYNPIDHGTPWHRVFKPGVNLGALLLDPVSDRKVARAVKATPSHGRRPVPFGQYRQLVRSAPGGAVA